MMSSEKSQYEAIPNSAEETIAADFEKTRIPVSLKCTAFLSIAVSILALWSYASPATSEIPAVLSTSKMPLPTQVMYRPCEIVDSEPSISVIQTSLGEAHAQWSEQVCAPTQTFPPMDILMPSATLSVNFANPSMEYMSTRPPILGFGGAFTEAAALNYNSLSPSGKKASMELLFGKSGLGYSLGRVPMNSCDFSVESYSFDDTDGDFGLDNFDTEVTHDVRSGMVDMMIEADVIAREGWEDNADGMRIMASPWSPPAWMKAPIPGEDPSSALHAEFMTGSVQPSCLRDGTGPDSKYARSWALYFQKFITAYLHQGISLWAVTVQNEPEFPAPWEACSYTADVEASFIESHLGPLLEEEHPNVKLFIFDHNKDHAPSWIEDIVAGENGASKYVDGTAIHWYAGGMDRLLDGAVGSPNMHRVFHDLKDMKVKNDHIVLGSEACHCPSTGYAGGDLKVAWARAERYAHTVLADLAAGSNGWVEWNLILDSVGGPNHLGNMCDAPILAVPHRAKGAFNVTRQMPFEHAGNPFGRVVGDGRTRAELDAMGVPAKYLDEGLVVQPMFYYMGHISRHVRPGSRPIPALVDGGGNNKPFRVEGQVVAGGGINDLARNGVELTMWPCEGSTRQEWKLNTLGQLQVFGHDWLGEPTSSCISKHPDTSFQGLVLTSCEDGTAGSFLLENVQTDHVRIVLQDGNDADIAKNDCLLLKPLKNGGGAYGKRGGAQVDIGDCALETSLWQFSESTGEIVSEFYRDEGGDVCVTTGWPFLQAGAFVTPENSKVVVILNEAGEAANFIMKDDDRVILSSSIPAHSIQTVTVK